MTAEETTTDRNGLAFTVALPCRYNGGNRRDDGRVTTHTSRQCPGRELLLASSSPSLARTESRVLRARCGLTRDICRLDTPQASALSNDCQRPRRRRRSAARGTPRRRPGVVRRFCWFRIDSEMATV